MTNINFKKYYNFFKDNNNNNNENENLHRRLTFSREVYKNMKEIKILNFFCQDPNSIFKGFIPSFKKKKILRGTTYRILNMKEGPKKNINNFFLIQEFYERIRKHKYSTSSQTDPNNMNLDIGYSEISKENIISSNFCRDSGTQTESPLDIYISSEDILDSEGYKELYYSCKIETYVKFWEIQKEIPFELHQIVDQFDN